MNTKEDGRVKVPFFLDYTFVWQKNSVQDRWPSDHMFFRRKQRPHGAFRTIWTSICTIETLQAAAAGLLGLLSGRLDTKIHLHILQWLQWSFIPSSLTWSLWPGAEETNKAASEKWNISKLRQRRFFEICIYLFQTSRGQRQSFWQQSSSVDAHAESSSLVTIDDQFEVQVHLRLWVRAHAKNNDESAFPASDEVSSKNLKDEMETIQFNLWF